MVLRTPAPVPPAPETGGRAAASEEAAGAVAAPHPVVGITARTVLDSLGELAGALGRHPVDLALRAGRLGLAWAGNGPAPSTVDRRFSHPAWDRLPYRLLGREYLALRELLLDSVDRSGLEGDRAERARFAAVLVAEALAPTNTLLLNPAGLERLVDTRGGSAVRGALNLLDDLRHNGAMPSVSRRSAHTVGEDLACTPGQVVQRSAVAEVLQFRPPGDDVHLVPLLMVPSPVNKYYVLDLAPGRSLVEFALAAGIQLFTVSWRNPTGEQRDWGLDTYVRAVEEALDAVAEITGSPQVNLLGVCAGGLISACAQAHGGASAEVPAATYLVSGIDNSWPSTFGALAKSRAVDRLAQRTRRRGVHSGRDIARTFAWMRPRELFWGPWVTNYVLGEDPPSTDILFWNSDLTNLPARFHAEQLAMLTDNPFARAGGTTVLGRPVDLSAVRTDAYYLGALNDHIVPWQACHRSSRLLGGTVRFVVGSGGHIQCLVSPPGVPKAKYWSGTCGGHGSSQAWMDTAQEHTGSWWEDWMIWLTERSGERRPAPRELGSLRFPPLEAAPGRYVHEPA